MTSLEVLEDMLISTSKPYEGHIWVSGVVIVLPWYAKLVPNIPVAAK